MDAGTAKTSLWRNRDFTLLWASQAVSQIGRHSSGLAFTLLVLAGGGSAVEAGAVGTVGSVVQVVMQLPGGALADRWDRRRLMVTSDAVRMCLFSLLAVSVVQERVSLPVVLVVAAGAAACDALFSPAEMAAVGQVVPGEQLPEAFAQNEARSYAAQLVGPSLGGLLFTWGRAAPFVFDALSYLVSWVAVSMIRTPLQRRHAGDGRQPVLAGIREGVAHVLGRSFLREVVMIAAPLNLALSAALFTVVVSLRGNGVPDVVIGVSTGAVSVGGLLGALAAPWLQRAMSFRRLLVVITWLLFGCFVAATVATGLVVMALPLALGVLLAPAANSSLYAHLLETTPEHVQGRVVSVVMLGATLSASVAPLACGALIDHSSATVAMALACLPVALSAVVVLTGRGLRELSSSR